MAQFISKTSVSAPSYKMRVRSLVLVVFAMSCGEAFSQDQAAVGLQPNIEAPQAKISSQSGSSAAKELLIWFMGNKQFSPTLDESRTDDDSGKKIFINLGMSPNRILSKSLMKKALNFEQTTA